MTIKDFSDTIQPSTRTVQRWVDQYNKKHGTSHDNGLNSFIPADLLTFLTSKAEGKNVKTVRTGFMKTRLEETLTAPIVVPRYDKKEISPKFTIPVALMDAINFIDMGLVLIGSWRLFEVPGLAMGIMACIFFYEAQKNAKLAALRSANRNAISVAGWLCFAFFFLHFITFWNAGPSVAIFNPISEKVYNDILKIISALAPATIVASLSFQSILTTNKKANDEKQLQKH